MTREMWLRGSVLEGSKGSKVGERVRSEESGDERESVEVEEGHGV